MPYCAAARASSAASRLRFEQGQKVVGAFTVTHAGQIGRRNTIPIPYFPADAIPCRRCGHSSISSCSGPTSMPTTCLRNVRCRPRMPNRRNDGTTGRREDRPASSTGILRTAAIDARDELACQAHADGTSAGLTRRSTTPRVAASRSISQTETGRITAARFVTPVPLASRAHCHCRFDQERSGTTRISTRRFCARPASVALSAIG